jgi:hypothetical protein
LKTGLSAERQIPQAKLACCGRGYFSVLKGT